MNSIYIGIDGGGSKTKLRMQDAQGSLLAEVVAGPANIFLSVDKAYHSILEAFHLALEQANIAPSEMKKYSLHAGMGLAGFEIKSARVEFLQKELPFDSVTLQSDAYIACLGAHGGQNGAIVIAGTGVVGLKIAGNTKTQFGGWGFPHGDEGGGAWLGFEAIKKVLHMFDQHQEPTPLLNDLRKKIGSRKEEFTQWVCNASATQYAALTPIVVKYAAKNDPVAVNLLKQGAKHIECILTLFLQKNKENKKNTPCCFIGGMAPILLDYIKKDFQKKLSQPLFDSCQGAILMIKRS